MVIILQIRFPLWSTVRLKVIITWQSPSRGLPLFATKERTEQLCVFEPRKLSPLSGSGGSQLPYHHDHDGPPISGCS
jgi:hypothetical protein